jgi:mannosyltransferase
MNTPSPVRTWAAALLVIAVLVGWRIVAVQHTYMRDDEEIAFRTTQYDLGYTLWYQAEQDIQAPLWFALFWAWQQAAGSSEFAARLLSILLMMLTLALVYRIGRRWFGGARGGLFAVGILGVNSYFFIYTLEIRPYPLVMLTAALSMWCFERWLARSTPRAAAAYGLTLALALYVHYFLAFLVAAQFLYLLLMAGLTRARLVQFVGAAALGFALWLPWLPNFFSQLVVLRRLAEEAGAVYGLGIGTTSTAEPTNAATLGRLVQIATNGIPVVYGAALLLGILAALRGLIRRVYGLALAWALAVPAVALALNLVMAVYAQRYVSYLSIGLALAVGAALGSVQQRRLRLAALAVFIGANVWALGGQLPVRIPYRDLFAAMSAEAGEVVYFTRAGEDDPFVLWQVRAYLSPEFQVILDGDMSAVETARRAWFVTGDWFNPAVRADFERLESTHPVQMVLGQCSRAWCYLAQLMEAPPAAEPTRFGGVLPFRGADIDAVTPEATRVRLWWQTDAPIRLDYSIGLHLRDSAGNLVAQSDGAIAHYGVETVQTSQMQPGRIYIDHRTLALPPGLPDGQYPLELVVYQSWDGLRLTLPSGAEALLLSYLNFPLDLKRD